VSILRHSAWAAAAAIVLTVARFLFAAILARRLSLTDFGQYVYGQWLADLTFMVCSLGAMGAISRYVAEFRHDPGLLTAVVRRWRPFALGLPWVAAAAVPFAAWLSGLSLDANGLALLALLTMTSGLWAMQTAALTGMQRFDLAFGGSVVAAVVLVAGALWMPLDANGPSRVFGLMALASGSAAVVGSASTRRLLDGPPAVIDAPRWRGIREYAINMWLTALLWSLVWSRGEMPIVRAYLGDAGVAHYAAALVLFGGAIQGVMLATGGVAPQLTRLWGEGGKAQAVALARRIMDMQLLVCGAAAVMLIGLGPEVMQLAFGAGFRAGSTVLAVLSLGLIGLTVSCQNHLLQIATDGRFSRNATSAGLIALMASATVLVASAGLFGAAVARAGTMLLMAGVSLFFVHRRWGGAAYSLRNVVAVLAIVVACVAVQPQLADLSWVLRAGVALLAAGLLTVAVRDAEGRMQVTMIVQRLRLAMGDQR
jgi:O-antigen/teichoic acid export membrane protein